MAGQFSRQMSLLALSAAWPLDVRLGLYTTPISDNALGTEYAATGYSKQGVRRTFIPDPLDLDPPELKTVDPVQFGPFTGNTGAEVGWVAAFPSTGGTTAAEMVCYWELDEHKTPMVGDSLIIEAGSLAMACA